MPDINQHTEALQIFRRALRNDERAIINAEIDTRLAATLHSPGGRLLDMKQHVEALQYFRRAQQIYEREPLNPETDTSLATTLHELDECLLNMINTRKLLNIVEEH